MKKILTILAVVLLAVGSLAMVGCEEPVEEPIEEEEL